MCPVPKGDEPMGPLLFMQKKIICCYRAVSQTSCCTQLVTALPVRVLMQKETLARVE